jgi:hypothetical protein
MTALSSETARRTLHSLGSGEPPPMDAISLLSVGLQRDLRIFTREYFSRDGGLLASPNATTGTFKIIEAYYGGGKTHYLRAVEREAAQHGFASAFVNLRKDECPLTRFDLIYQAVAEALRTPDLPPGKRGIADVIRHWLDRDLGEDVDPVAHAQEKVALLGDLPLAGMKLAIREAALAHASGDAEMFDQAQVYLANGQVTPLLRKKGIVQAIKKESGSLALRSVVHWLRQIGYPGLVFILDEGDRSLSLSRANDKRAASNNLVQLINETNTEGSWPGVLLLYSIPSWDSFASAFQDNAALISRVRNTGFPMNPPAARINLDARTDSDAAKIAFCKELGARLYDLFALAYADTGLSSDDAARLATDVADVVVEQEITNTFRRIFVQTYISALNYADGGDVPSRAQIEQMALGEADKVSSGGD